MRVIRVNERENSQCKHREKVKKKPYAALPVAPVFYPAFYLSSSRPHYFPFPSIYAYMLKTNVAQK